MTDRYAASPRRDVEPPRACGASRLRRLFAGAAVTGLLCAALGAALGPIGAGFTAEVPDSSPKAVGALALELPAAVPAVVAGPYRQGLAGALPERFRSGHGAIERPDGSARIVLVELKPGQQERVEAWRAEGIRKAAELTGIPEAFFWWLEDHGVPVGEFMRFVIPFLEWLEMIEAPHNATKPSSPPRNQPRDLPRDQPRQTTI